MAQKINKFRNSINPKSISFVKQLNELVDAVNKSNNLKISGGTGTTLIDSPRGKTFIIKSGGNGVVGSDGADGQLVLSWAIIVESLEYATGEGGGVCQYKCVLWPDEESTDYFYPQLITDTDINGVSRSNSDYRSFVPWLRVNDVVPIISHSSPEDPSDTGEVDTDDCFFLQTFSYVGSNLQKSISWNQDSNRLMAVYR